MASKFQCSQETQEKVDSFDQADKAFKAAWADFEQQHQQEIDNLDKLREERNKKLDDAKRALRAEAEDLDITEVKQFRQGPFRVDKRWTSFYSPEKFVALLKDKGLFDSALSATVVAERVEIAKFDTVKSFLENEGVAKDFEGCEDGDELTPAVYGPKPVPPFGAEFKEK